MDVDESLKELRRIGLSNGTALGRHVGIADIAADKLEELNNFEQNQCAKLLGKNGELTRELKRAKRTICEMCRLRSREQNMICGCARCKYGSREEN